MPILPKPYPDEVIGSVIIRACFQSGMPLKRLLDSIYGKNRSNVSFLMASRLGRLAVLAGTDAEELLERHTVFPYAVAFMPRHERARLRDKALGPVAGRDSISAITKSISHGVPFRRYCQACAADELEEYGESYWHRAHLLPGVLVCRKHSAPLTVAYVPVRRHTHMRTACLPGDAPFKAPSTKLPALVITMIADMSVAALAGRMDGAVAWSARYRAMALAKGYRLSGGAVAGALLAADLLHFYRPRFLADVGCTFSYEARNTWPSLMVREHPSVPFATPKHVLLQTFLALGEPVGRDAVERYRLPGPPRRNYERMDKQVAMSLRDFLVRKAGSAERYTVRVLLVRARAWSAYRHDRTRFPETKALLMAFKTSSQSERQAGRRPYWRKRLGLE